MEPTLGYWKIRGLAQPLRLMHAYAGVAFKDVKYEIGPGYHSYDLHRPEFSKDEWLNVKYELGLDFPNLPYYKDGDVKLTQSMAIVEYLSEKFNLNGTTVEERNLCNMSMFELIDLNSGFTRIAYNGDYANLKSAYLESALKKLSQLNSFLGRRKFFAGEKVTKVDFIAFEVFDKLLIVDSTLFDKTPELVFFHTRFQNLPSIKKYLADSEELPMNNKIATYGDVVVKKILI